MILKKDGHPIFTAESFKNRLIEDSSAAYWDKVNLAGRYRSRRDFIAMVASTAYQQIALERTFGFNHAAVSAAISAVNRTPHRPYWY